MMVSSDDLDQISTKTDVAGGIRISEIIGDDIDGPIESEQF